MFSKLPKILTTTLSFFLVSIILATVPPLSYAESANHIVISEIQIRDASSSTHDFVELYNPTSSTISLNGLRLVKRTSTGSNDDAIVSFSASASIPSHGYFLWCNSSLNTSLSCDASTSASIAVDNSVGLRNGPIQSGTPIDLVTIGTVSNPLVEGSVISTPPTNSQSVERKANSSSTSSTMGSGGSDEFNGNGEDTDNNANDFVLRNNPQPQNSSSSLEPVPTQTPSATSTSSPTSSATPTDTPMSTITTTPTETPSETPTITQTPSESPTPTESTTPTSSPTATSTISVTTNLSVTPTLSPKPTGTFPFITIPKFKTICSTNIIHVQILFAKFNIPMTTCKITTL